MMTGVSFMRTVVVSMRTGTVGMPTGCEDGSSISHTSYLLKNDHKS